MTALVGPCPEVSVDAAYYDLDEAAYHADPCIEGSLSNSGAKLILQSPAAYKWALDHPTTAKHFEFGRAAHARVLGRGAPVAAVPPDLLGKNGAVSTAAAKEWVAKAQSSGITVLKEDEIAVIDEMERALREHPVAWSLLSAGRPEVSLFWRDEETRIMLRARPDWMTTLPSGRPCIVDYKTTARSADPTRWGWEARDLGYHLQDHHYREGADRVLEPGHAFVFLVQEKKAPYLVSVCEIDEGLRDVGAHNHGVARRTYLACRTADEWPGYAPIMHRVSATASYAPEYQGVTNDD